MSSTAGEAAEPPLLNPQLLVSGLLLQLPKAIYSVTFELPVTAKATLQEALVNESRPPDHMLVLTAAPWEPVRLGAS